MWILLFISFLSIGTLTFRFMFDLNFCRLKKKKTYKKGYQLLKWQLQPIIMIISSVRKGVQSKNANAGICNLFRNSVCSCVLTDAFCFWIFSQRTGPYLSSLSADWIVPVLLNNNKFQYQFSPFQLLIDTALKHCLLLTQIIFF